MQTSSKSWLDLANPSDDIVKFMAGITYSEQRVRTAIDDIFSQPNMDAVVKRLAIFTK